MKQKICIFLAMAMLMLAFTGCGSDTVEQGGPTAVGTWTAQIDMAEAVSRLVYSQTGAPTVSVRFPVSLQLTLSKDGTYILSIDEQMLNEQINNLMDVLWNIVVEQSAAQTHKTTLEAQEALQNQGRSRELLMQQLDFTSYFTNTFKKSGFWKQSEGKLYFADSVDALETATGYELPPEANQLMIHYETYGAEPQQRTLVFNKEK